MCGICGIIATNGVRNIDLMQMTASMRHRGPDDSGIYIDPQKTFGFGHRRLSIIDLDSGKQPMTNKTQNLWITFNGEIYNYKEIREKKLKNVAFKTQSDTEVILYLYEKMGKNCVNYIRGMFAFAIYDKNTEELFIARDHLGQKPLYYYHNDKVFAFSSEIKGLLSVFPELKEMNEFALYEYLTVRIITPPRSMFKKIQKLPPAHYLIFKNGKLTKKRYWDLSYRNKITSDFTDTKKELERIIQETINYHLVSDVPVGAFLSGGIDSSLVVAMMNSYTGKEVKTFSGDVPYGNFSEISYANMVAKKYRTQHHRLKVTPSLIKTLPDVIWHLDEPSDSLSVCMYCLAELTQKYVKVVLGGDGGDELFGGYDRYYGNVIASYYALLPDALRKKILERLIKILPEGFWYRSISHQFKWMHQISFFKEAERYGKSLSYFYFSDGYKRKLYTNRFIKSVGMFDPEGSIKSYYNINDAKEHLDKMLYADSMVRMPDHPNMILDRMTMAHGLEARSPFLDHKLAEFCALIPSKYKVKGTKRRIIQLELAKKYLPPALIKRKKQGFNSPLPYMLENEYDVLFRVFLVKSSLVENGYLKKGAIKNLLQEHLSRKADHGNRLWLLCNAEMWYRMFIQNQSRYELQKILERETA